MAEQDSAEHPYRRLLDAVLREHVEKNGHGVWSPAVVRAEKAISAIEDEYRLSIVERLVLRQAILDEMTEQYLAQCPIYDYKPKWAPELWSDREGRKENPASFVRRVYERWLGRGITRSDLRSLDPSLYQALAMWMRRHPEESMPELISPMQVLSDQIKEALGGKSVPDKDSTARPDGPKRKRRS